VYHEGDPSEEIYILKSGELGFYKRIKTGNSNKKTFDMNVANIGEGEIFGEDEILSRCPRCLSCKCNTDVSIIYSVSKNVSFR
jgi:CRP-like cAMP-binding protein